MHQDGLTLDPAAVTNEVETGNHTFFPTSFRVALKHWTQSKSAVCTMCISRVDGNWIFTHVWLDATALARRWLSGTTTAAGDDDRSQWIAVGTFCFLVWMARAHNRIYPPGWASLAHARPAHNLIQPFVEWHKTAKELNENWNVFQLSILFVAHTWRFSQPVHCSFIDA